MLCIPPMYLNNCLNSVNYEFCQAIKDLKFPTKSDCLLNGLPNLIFRPLHEKRLRIVLIKHGFNKWPNLFNQMKIWWIRGNFFQSNTIWPEPSHNWMSSCIVSNQKKNPAIPFPPSFPSIYLENYIIDLAVTLEGEEFGGEVGMLCDQRLPLKIFGYFC